MQPQVQAAVFQWLNGHVTAPVYDVVPKNASFPYAVIGEDSFEADDTDDSFGGEAFVEIEIWSKYEGKKEAKVIAREIYQRLHRASLDVQGYSLAVAHWESSNTFDQTEPGDPTPTTLTVETYRIVIHE